MPNPTASNPGEHRADQPGDRSAGWMDLWQAAAFLRVSPTRLITAAEAGQVPAHRRAGRLLFRTAEVRAALATPAHSQPRRAAGDERDGGGGS